MERSVGILHQMTEFTRYGPSSGNCLFKLHRD